MEQIHNLNNQKDKIQKNNDLEKRNEKEKSIHDKIENLFDVYDNGEERIGLLLELLAPLINDNLIKDQDQMKINLLNCSKLNNKNEFVDKVMETITPLITFLIDNPDLEKRLVDERPLNLRRKIFNDFNKYEQIGQYISYGITGRTLHIHLPDASDLIKGKSRSILFSEMENDFNNLAEILNNHKEIKEVTASSWIVANNPNILEKLGFVIDHEHDSIDKEGRKTSVSYIPRDKFLEKYLKN